MTRQESTSEIARYTINHTETLFGALLMNLRTLPENKNVTLIELLVPRHRCNRPMTIADSYIPDQEFLVPCLINAGFMPQGESGDYIVYGAVVRDNHVGDVTSRTPSPRNIACH